MTVKKTGVSLFDPEKGGSYEVFNVRPLSPPIFDYCVLDVSVTPKLLKVYASKLQAQPHLAPQIHSTTLSRITQSQSPHFDGNGNRDHMRLGPVNIRKRYVNAGVFSNGPTLAIVHPINHSPFP